jgi:hypothetical protein
VNLEIEPNGSGNHVVTRGGRPLARFDSVKAAMAFVLAELLGPIQVEAAEGVAK